MTAGRVRLIGGAVIVAFALVAAFVASRQVEAGLDDDANAALDAAGMGDVQAEADGRDIVLRGEDLDEATSLMGQLDGVRDVRIAEPEAAAPQTSTSVSVDTTSPIPSTTTSTTAPPSTTAAPTTTTQAPTTTVSPPTTAPGSLLQVAIDEAAGSIDFLTEDPDEPTVETKARLDRVAEILLDEPDLRVGIVGHVSTMTDVAADLSLARAWSVAGYLEWRGVDFSRMDVSGVGDTDPLYDDPADARNDRVDILIVEGE